MGMNYPLEIERWIFSDGIKIMEMKRYMIPIPKGIDNNELILENFRIVLKIMILKVI